MKKFFIVLSMFSLPVFAFAAPGTFKEFVAMLLEIIQNTITIFMSAIVVGIIYAVMLYMINSDNEKKREQIKGYLIYAVIGLSVIMGLWGIIEILTSTLGWDTLIPQLTTP